MLQKTNGIVLRSVKYGDTSLVTTIFTAQYGVQTYMVQGVRSTRAKQNRAGFFQPGVLLELVVYMQPQKNMQRIREYAASYLYTNLQEDVVRNSISMFSVEVLLRLLPEHAPLPALFDIVTGYFMALDKKSLREVANFPLYFMIQCSKVLGYDPERGTTETQSMQHDVAPAGTVQGAMPFISNEDTAMLNRLLAIDDLDALQAVEMNADTRLRLTDWYVSYLQQHTQHMGHIRSLTVLRAILH